LIDEPERAGLRVYTSTTVRSFKVAAGKRIVEVHASTAGGGSLRVAAQILVLAAGAIENARLLLLNSAAEGIGLDGRRWVGLCFMEHPRDTAMTLAPATPDIIRRASFYDVFTASDGTPVIGRLAFADGPPADTALPNMSVALQPLERASSGFRNLLRRVSHDRSRAGYGWSRHRDAAESIDRFRLCVSLEQRPDPSNRITLGASRDSLGQPRAVLHWRWHADAQAQLENLRKLIASELQSARIGETTWTSGSVPDPNAGHHAGTTRMASAPEHGVVDVDGRVFGSDNLYVTGASVMPTAGSADPTLTIVALALRLAARLASDTSRGFATA
jgi:choline dehydrogenase-like flavoprotein